MDKRINENLLNSLFISPNPLSEKKEIYNYLFDRIFPDRYNFQRFLSVYDFNDKLELAKSLIKRLCFESNFPPAYEILINLLDYENSESNQSISTDYIPQDHFIHILNSYIFGVYLFFYHPLISKKLTEHFIGNRNEDNINPALSASKDFISFWKYFCLYHDICYPIESAFEFDKNKQLIVKSSSFLNYLTPFENLPFSFFREWISIALSRFLSVYDLVTDIENKDINKVFINKKSVFLNINNHDKLDYQETTEKFKDYKLIDKLYSFEHFKLFTTFIKKQNILIVLIDKYSENPIGFKYFENDEEIIYKIQYYYDDLSGLDLEYYLDNEDDNLSNRFIIKFCVKGAYECFLNICPNYGMGKINNEHFQKLKKHLVKFNDIHNQNLLFEGISESSELNTYIYNYYIQIYNYCSDVFKDEDVKTFIKDPKEIKKIRDKDLFSDIYKTGLDNLIVEQLNEIIDNCSLGYKKKIIDWLGSKQNDTDLEMILKTILLSIINYQKDNLDEINNTIRTELKEKVLFDQKGENTLIHILSKIGNSIYIEELFNPSSNYRLKLKDYNWNDFVNTYDRIKNDCSFIKNIIEKTNEYINNKTNHAINCVNDFSKHYKNRNFAIDHGIMGYYLYILSEYH